MNKDTNKKPFNPRPWNRRDTEVDISPEGISPETDINSITASGVTLGVDFTADDKDRTIHYLEHSFYAQREEISELKNKIAELEAEKAHMVNAKGFIVVGPSDNMSEVSELVCRLADKEHERNNALSCLAQWENACRDRAADLETAVNRIKDLEAECGRLSGALHSAEQRNRESTNCVLLRRVDESCRERDSAWEAAKQENRNAAFYRDLLGQCAKLLGDGCRRQDDGGMVPEGDFLALRVPEVLEHTLDHARKVISDYNDRTACGHGLFGAGGTFGNVLTIGQDVVIDGMKWMADTIKNHKAALDTERELRRAAENNMSNLLDFASGRSSTRPVSGQAVSIKNEIIRLRELADAKPHIRKLVASTLGKATNDILKGLSSCPEAEPQYRMLEVGEVIEAGDEYHSSSGWVPSCCVGGLVAPLQGKQYYRRKVTP